MSESSPYLFHLTQAIRALEEEMETLPPFSTHKELLRRERDTLKSLEQTHRKIVRHARRAS